MGHLGVSQLYSDQKNMDIILLHHARHGEALTKRRVTFLILCWKGRHRERARMYKHEYERFLSLSQTEQQRLIAKAKEEIERQRVILKVSI